jgi:hypothetical protein
MTISGSGNVGIGTTNPVTGLHVVNGMQVQGGDLSLLNNPTGASVNIATYNSEYGYIDLATTHNDGS